MIENHRTRQRLIAYDNAHSELSRQVSREKFNRDDESLLHSAHHFHRRGVLSTMTIPIGREKSNRDYESLLQQLVGLGTNIRIMMITLPIGREKSNRDDERIWHSDRLATISFQSQMYTGTTCQRIGVR
jgi:hypothetical protein